MIFLIVSYCTAFKKTFAEKRFLKENKRQIISLEEAPVQLQFLEKRLKGFEKLFNEGVQNPQNYQVFLLERTTSILSGFNISVKEIPNITMVSSNGFITKTQQIVFQGSFIDLLKFLECIGRDHSVGNICSVDFYTQKGYKTGASTLKMKIYFQNITESKQQ